MHYWFLYSQTISQFETHIYILNIYLTHSERLQQQIKKADIPDPEVIIYKTGTKNKNVDLFYCVISRRLNRSECFRWRPYLVENVFFFP